MYTPLPLVEGVLSPVPPGPTVPIKCYLGNVGFQMYIEHRLVLGRVAYYAVYLSLAWKGSHNR